MGMVSTCLYHLCMVIWGMVYYCFNHIMLNDKCPWRYWCSTNSVIFFTLEPVFWLIPVHCSISLVRRYTISSLYRLNKIEPVAQVSIWMQPLIYNPHTLSQFDVKHGFFLVFPPVPRSSPCFQRRAPERSPPPPPRSPRRSAPSESERREALRKVTGGRKQMVFIWFYMVFHGLVEVWKLQTLWLFTWYDNRVHFEATEMKSHIHLSYPHLTSSNPPKMPKHANREPPARTPRHAASHLRLWPSPGGNAGATGGDWRHIWWLMGFDWLNDSATIYYIYILYILTVSDFGSKL